MKQQLIDFLETEYGYPVRLQGSLAKDEQYPASFFTIWNPETLDGNHYDNEAVWYEWRFTVYFFSIDPALVNSVPLDCIRKLKRAGWIIDGKGSDAPSDEITHTGRQFDCSYIELSAANY